jgi:serine/threonine-protein kinase
MFSSGSSGAIAFLAPIEGGGPDVGRSLVWVTREGREEPIAAPPGPYASARLSPDATRIAVDIRDEGNDIGVWSIDRGVLSRLTNTRNLDMAPIWTPDGRRIVWSSPRDNINPALYVPAADGTGSPERLNTGGIAFPGSITPDGRTILFFNGSAILRRPLAGEGTAERLLGSLQMLSTPEVSPDGRWLAYQSNESGQPEVYVRPYPNIDDGRWQISTSHGTRPAWSRNGRELFFLDRADRLSVAPIAVNGGTLVPGTPRRLLDRAYFPGFTTRGSNIRGYDVSPDGQRFLMIKGTEEGSSSKSVMTIAVNWRPQS